MLEVCGWVYMRISLPIDVPVCEIEYVWASWIKGDIKRWWQINETLTAILIEMHEQQQQIFSKPNNKNKNFFKSQQIFKKKRNREKNVKCHLQSLVPHLSPYF